MSEEEQHCHGNISAGQVMRRPSMFVAAHCCDLQVASKYGLSTCHICYTVRVKWKKTYVDPGQHLMVMYDK